MRVMVAIEDRYYKAQNGKIYSGSVCDYTFWSRYLQVFDEVIVFARFEEIPETELDKPIASGPNVDFYGLPDYSGPWQYLKHYHRLNSIAKKALSRADAYILRIPGFVATLLGYRLGKNDIPYGVEVVSNAWDVLGVGTFKSILRPVARYVLAKNQKEQCQRAIASAYVTERCLQQQFPPGGWSTHYSSIDLHEGSVIDNQRFAERITSLHDAVNGQRAFRICHAGTMSTFYKGQDVLMEAISLCRAEGFEIELTLLGDGRYSQYFIKKARELGIAQNVKFLANVRGSEAVQEHLDMADMFILPSFTEGLPRVLIEAMARGMPCIATNVGGIPELLDPEDMVPRRNAELLAAKTMSTIHNIERLERMAKRNLQTAKKYRLDKLNGRRVEFYRKVAEETNLWYANRNKLRK